MSDLLASLISACVDETLLHVNGSGKSRRPIKKGKVNIGKQRTASVPP